MSSCLMSLIALTDLPTYLRHSLDRTNSKLFVHPVKHRIGCISSNCVHLCFRKSNALFRADVQENEFVLHALSSFSLRCKTRDHKRYVQPHRFHHLQHPCRNRRPESSSQDSHALGNLFSYLDHTSHFTVFYQHLQKLQTSDMFSVFRPLIAFLTFYPLILHFFCKKRG